MVRFAIRVFAASVLCMGLSAAVPASDQTTQSVVSAGMPVYVRDIEPGAQSAVKVVDDFSAAIKSGDIGAAAKLLDPALLVLESGGSERSRDQYLAEHAAADAQYMKTVEQQLRYRQARVVGELAWVATESIMTRKEGDLSSISLSTETMLLRSTKEGWKIVHIHWSSRPVG